MTNLAIILPAYNEAQTIAESISSFYEQTPDATLVIVDNNSSDDTTAIAEQTLKSLQAKGMVLSEPRQGKGFAVRRAFALVEADIYVMADADCTYPSDEVHQLIQPILDDEADMVVGDRLSEGHYRNANKRRFHNSGNALVTSLVNVLYSVDLKDILSGFRAFNRDFVKNYPVLVSGFELETDMTLHALDKRFRIVEMPIAYRDRPEGSESKINTFGDGFKVIFTIFQVFRYYKPLVFFGAMAVLCLLLMVISAIPVLNDWLVHRYIYHVPLAILASALGLLSSLFFALGLILDAINHQYRMKFERDWVMDSRQGQQQPPYHQK